jgi:hypothetical protein
MPNTVIALKSSGTTSSEPDVGTLANGELALNFADGILFYKTSTGTLGTISSGGSGTPGGLDTEVQFNDAGSFGGNSFFTFDKTTGTVNVSNVVVTNTITTGTGSGGIITGANVIYSNTFVANTGSGGVIAGANVIYSNTFVANTGGYIEFADGTKQYTANAGSAGSDQTARDTANAAFNHANGSFGHANGSFNHANGGFNFANTVNIKTDAAFNHANGSFNSSNSIINGTVTIKANIDSDSITANSITINVSSRLFSLGVGTPSSGVEGEIRAANVIYSNTFIANTGSGGVIAGANVIYSNTFVANTGGYIEFADGTKQYTANAGSAGSDQTARDTANAAFNHANGSFNSSNSIINGTVTIKANIDSDSITANSITINVSSQLFSLGVGTPSSGVEGEIRAANDVTAFYSSDIRLKENVVQISHALEKVMQINGVHFDWKDDYIEERGGEDGFFVRKNNIGIIAQEIEKVLPEIVVTKPNGYKAVRYELIVALLIQAIKELNEKIDKMSK